VGPRISASPTREVGLDWQGDNLSIETLRRRLADTRETAVRVTSIPNARVVKDVRIAELLRNAGPEGTVVDVRRMAEEVAAGTVSPTEMVGLGTELGFRVRVRPNLDDPTRFDSIFDRAPSNTSGADVLGEGHGASGARPLTEYANDPLRGRFGRQIGPVLKAFVAERLPHYMVPSAVVPLARMPLTPNGKIDIPALPASFDAISDAGPDFVPPHTRTEHAVAKLFSDVLGVRRVGRTDNFFDLGGHSLMAMALMAAVDETFGIDVPVSALYESTTLAEFAATIEQTITSATPPDRRAPL
jgi:acyl carrier protein